jgi:hypothetical protein
VRGPRLSRGRACGGERLRLARQRPRVHGHAYISFDGSASGPIEGSGGSESISLDRRGASLQLKLTHEVRGRGELSGITIFSGKVRMGNVSVDDTFSLSEGNGDSGEATYQGPALGQLGTASVFLDTDDCVYAVTAGFGAKTQYSGEGGLRPGSGVSVAAFGDREKIPGNLHLVGRRLLADRSYDRASPSSTASKTL